VSREDPDRQNVCKSCSPGNLVEETIDHILQCLHQLRRDAMHDRFEGMTKTFRSWKSSHLVIDALRTGALAWIDGNPAPAVGTSHLPDSPLEHLVRRTYVEQTSMGWNLLFRGFWTISWRTAQEYEFSHGTLQRRFTDNGASWAGRAQMWMFDLAWGLRNDNEHGADPESQRRIGLAKCGWVIRRLSSHERFPFSDPMEEILAKTASTQESWVTDTEAYPTYPRLGSESRDRKRCTIAHSLNTGSMVRSALLEFISTLAGFFSLHVVSKFPLESCRSSQAHPFSFILPSFQQPGTA
jgi:hypothetical protein